MRILVTGKGSAGSWTIRGEQLGNAIGATVIPNASLEQQKGYDITICVKKPPKHWNPSGIVVWDMVDPWPQPSGNSWDKEALVSFIHNRKAEIGAHYSVAATQQMQIDCQAEVCVYHHARPTQVRNPVRKSVSLVAYEGNPVYLGNWHDAILSECEKRGWSFAINPTHLSAADIVVAFRGYPYCGYPTYEWKSNVKLANAQATGTPFIGLSESGYKETRSGGETFIDSPTMLADAFDVLSPLSERQVRSAIMLKKSSQVCLDNIAEEYKEWLLSL